VKDRNEETRMEIIHRRRPVWEEIYPYAEIYPKSIIQ